ncbi:MAG TPA: hypothetical protein PK767_00045 [Clostridiales bacterium]|nr:hypothetical protein [Clostridiales bacterium]HPP34617.1 hypothetical protein [Clostridiales bacterium]
MLSIPCRTEAAVFYGLMWSQGTAVNLFRKLGYDPVDQCGSTADGGVKRRDYIFEKILG